MRVQMMARDQYTLDMWAAPSGPRVVPKTGPEADGLRHYQLEAYYGIHRVFEKHRSALLVLATGLGKTETFASVAKHWPGRVLVLAHRGELVDQAAKRLERMTGELVEVEQAQLRSHRARIVVGSLQTVTRQDRLEALERRGGFSLVIVDEAHHLTAPTYRRPIDFFKDAKVLGVTATPDRADGKALGRIFEDVAFSMGIVEGIREGYLVPLKGREVTVEEVNLDAVSVNAGDLAAGELDDVMVKGVEGVVRGMLHHAGDQQGIIFFPGVKSAHLAAARLNAIKPGCAVSLDGETDPDLRKEIVADFKAKRVQFLANCMLAVEGFDAPDVAVVGLARPTKSRSLYAQMCLDDKTEILTRSGWRGIDDAVYDVAAFDMSDGSVRFESADIVRRRLLPGESMYGIKSPGMDIRVTNLHKMVLRERTGRARRKSEWSLVDADAVPAAFEVPVSGKQSFPGCPLSDDEIRFIGLLMTDGSVHKTSKQAVLYQSERYPDVIDCIVRTLAACGFKSNRDVVHTPTNYGPRTHPLHRWTVSYSPRGKAPGTGWKRLESFYDKAVSPLLDTMDERQFGILVEAMWMANGRKKVGVNHKPKTINICSGRKDTLDTLQSMAVRRGWRCNVARQNETVWNVYMEPGKAARAVATYSKDARPTWGELPAKLRIGGERPERVWCATVSTGAIVTRRNGKVAIVGNCGRGTRVLRGVVDHIHGAEGAFDRRAAILASSKPHCLLLDFVGVNTKHSLMTPEDLLGGDMDEDVKKKAKELGKEEAHADKTVGELLDLGRAEIERLARALRSKVKSRSRDFDPFLAYGIDQEAVAKYEVEFGRKPMTDRQHAFLSKMGFKAFELDGLSRREASKLQAEVIKRREANLATHNQLRVLAKHGLADVAMSKATASTAMDYLSTHDWGRTADPVELRNIVEGRATSGTISTGEEW